MFSFLNVVTFSRSTTIFGMFSSERCNFFVPVIFSHLTKVFIFFFPPQVIFNAQKTSVPGDLILVPGATEKISFQKESKQQ